MSSDNQSGPMDSDGAGTSDTVEDVLTTELLEQQALEYRQRMEEEIAEVATSTDLSYNDTHLEYMRSRCVNQVMDMLIVDEQMMEDVKTRILLHQHIRAAQAGQEASSVSTSIRHEVRNQLNSIKQISADLTEGFSTRTEELEKMSLTVAELQHTVNTLSSKLEVLSEENTAGLEKVNSLENPIQNALNILESMESMSVGQFQDRAIEDNNTPAVYSSASPSVAENPAHSPPVVSGVLDFPDVLDATVHDQDSSHPEIEEIFSSNEDEQLQGNQQENSLEGNAAIDEMQEMNTHHAASNDDEHAIEIDNEESVDSLQRATSPISVEASSNVAQYSHQQETGEKRANETEETITSADASNDHESADEVNTEEQEIPLQQTTQEQVLVAGPTNFNVSVVALVQNDELDPFEHFLDLSRPRSRVEYVSDFGVASNDDELVNEVDTEEPEIPLQQTTQEQMPLVAGPTNFNVSVVAVVENEEQDSFEQLLDFSRPQSRMDYDSDIGAEPITQNIFHDLAVAMGYVDRDTDVEGPSEPSASHRQRRMEVSQRTSRKRVQHLTGNNGQPVADGLEDDELAQQLQLNEFNMRERRKKAGALKRALPDSLINDSKKKKSNKILDSPNNEEIGWYTLAVIASNMFSNSSLLTLKMMEELGKLTAPTREEYSKRTHYIGDVSFEEIERELTRICSVDTLQGIHGNDDDASDGESEVENENDVNNDKAVRRRTKKTKRSLNIRRRRVPEIQWKVVPLLYTAALKRDVINQTGQRIVDIAEESITDSNGIYTNGSVLGNNFFLQKGFAVVFGGTGERLPITTLNYYDARLEECAMSVSISLITDIISEVEESGSNVFSIDILKSVLGESTIDVLRQRPEPSHRNARCKESGNSIIMHYHSEELQFSVFLEKLEKVMKTAQEGFNNIVSECPIKKETVLAMQKELGNAHRPHVEGKADYPFPLVYFGINVDIPEEAVDQQRIIRKLHKWMQPGQGLMAHFPNVMQGITQAQAYFSEPGCRLSARFESQGLGSVNVNLGPDTYVWFAVPMKYVVNLEQLVREKNGKPYQSGLWLNEEMLIGAGVSYYKFEQKKGEIVVANSGTYYWIQSIGFAKMLSWNIMPASATQVAATALFCDDDAARGFPSILPFQKLMWEIARKKEYANSELSKLVKRFLVSCLAHCEMEYEKAKQEGWEIEEGSPELFESAIRCFEANCRRDTLFNLVFVEKHSTDPTTRFHCLQCARAKFVGRADKCYIRYPIGDLVRIFDEYN